MWQKQQQVRSHMACAPYLNEANESAERKLQSLIHLRNVYQTKDIHRFGQKVWKAFKFESSGRVLIVHLHVTVLKVLSVENFDRHVKIILDKNHQRSLAVAAFASVQAG